MGEGHRYSFEDAGHRRARELEEALELDRQVSPGEDRAQTADITGRPAEQVAPTKSVSTDRASRVHWVRAEHRETHATTAEEQPAEPDTAPEPGGVGATESEAIERVAAAARAEIKQTTAAETRRIGEGLAEWHDAMRKAAAKETVAFEESTRATVVELEDALHAQATQARDDMRRAADEQAATFEEVAGARVVEFQNSVREHSELLNELNRLHATTTEQIEEVRSLVAGLHDAQEDHADLDSTVERHVRMVVEGLAAGAEGPAPASASTPDLRGLDHQGRPVGTETTADDRVADLDVYVERSEATQRALEERLAELEEEMAASTSALDGRLAAAEQHPPLPRVEQFEHALAAAADGFEANLRAAADEHARRLEAAGVVTKNQLFDALARAEAKLAQAAEVRATDLGEMIAAARTTIERTAASRVESLETTAYELRDGIEDLRNGKTGRRFRRRAAPGATAVVLAVAAAVGGTMFVRNGGSDRPSVASANSPAAKRAAPTSTTLPGDAAPVSQVADELSKISWPAATAPVSGRPPSTSSPTTPGAPGTTTGAPTGTEAPASGGGGGQSGPEPTQPPPTSPPTSPPPPPPPTTEPPPPPPPTGPPADHAVQVRSA